MIRGRYASDAVAASIFVEPICFMLFLRTLTHNFLYQVFVHHAGTAGGRPRFDPEPPNGMFIHTTIHTQEYGGAIGYVIRSEFFLNHALRRHFWWQLKVLFVEDIEHPSLIYLTEQDEVVPTQEVREASGS